MKPSPKELPNLDRKHKTPRLVESVLPEDILDRTNAYWRRSASRTAASFPRQGGVGPLDGLREGPQRWNVRWLRTARRVLKVHMLDRLPLPLELATVFTQVVPTLTLVTVQ